MAVKKLLLDDFINDDPITLIAIHTSIEDYRLAYLLNKKLKLNLKRKRQNIDFNNKASYVIFEWKDQKQQTTWHLVSNISKVEKPVKTQENTLFNQEVIQQSTHYLIPEYKRVNFFLKIDDAKLQDENNSILKNIQDISQIVTTYPVDASTLKSKQNLIFY